MEMALQVLSISCLGIAAVTKPAAKSSYKLVSAAVLCFLAAKWLSHFIYKTFHFHDYDHSSVWALGKNDDDDDEMSLLQE